jgi:putative Mg2+ transporter-C (MgtC) family protein
MSNLPSSVYQIVTGNWLHLFRSPIAEMALMLVALASGAIIGSDRQKHEKPAGLRTLTLVALGSAGFTMVGFAFTGATGDSGRVAAQIVTGIGFLGAGVILHPRGAIVSGATTAASIWITASVGMMAGAGYAGAALGLSILVRMVLAGVTMYEERLFGAQPPVSVSLDFEPNEGLTRVRLERILVDYRISSAEMQWHTIKNGMQQLILCVHLPRHHLRELLDELVGIPEVKRVQEEAADPLLVA